ncbi:hypothetical protein SCUCBS95973_008121 [Sporothrix curviconia]|uniref:nitrilase n=1 Tax=Sporothrix curviconia TaxID=1260050 RepID=A0ABP0CKT3_9PEZI
MATTEKNTKARIAAVQAEPAWNDLQAGVNKVIAIVKEAGEKGANVVGFPEVFIPGYPWSIWGNSIVDNAEFMNEYFRNSLEKESPEMERICAAVREAGVFIVLGYSEHYRGSLYIGQSFIDPTGTIVHHRRKIKPTHVERGYWGDGQAESLKGVVETKFGKVSGLNCWEHTQTLLRYYQYSQDKDIHVASWPLIWDQPTDEWVYHITPEASNRFSQVMAMEGNFDFAKANSGGFTMIYGPDSRELSQPIDPGLVTIVFADVDLLDRIKAKQNLDIVGHYSRPDLLSLRVTTEPASVVHFKD